MCGRAHDLSLNLFISPTGNLKIPSPQELDVILWGIVTVFFLFGIIVVLVGIEPVRAFGRLISTFDRQHLAAARPVLIAAVIALVMGFGCEIVFTKIFYIDLPTG